MTSTAMDDESGFLDVLFRCRRRVLLRGVQFAKLAQGVGVRHGSFCGE